MAAENFNTCLKIVLAHEGGYVDHPADPGGATKYGITLKTLAGWRERPVSKAEVRALTKAEVGKIYRARYWNTVAGDDLPAGLDLAVFDFAVNSGPRRAATYLQMVLGVAADGVVGPMTLKAAAANPARTLSALMLQRRSFLQRLSTWATFGRGWSRRLAETEAKALEMLAPLSSHQTKETNMLDTKSPLKSTTIWGALTALVAQVLTLLGAPASVPEMAATGEIATHIVGLAGAGLAVWGRLRAKTVLQ